VNAFLMQVFVSAQIYSSPLILSVLGMSSANKSCGGTKSNQKPHYSFSHHGPSQ